MLLFFHVAVGVGSGVGSLGNGPLSVATRSPTFFGRFIFFSRLGFFGDPRASGFAGQERRRKYPPFPQGPIITGIRQTEIKMSVFLAISKEAGFDL